MNYLLFSDDILISDGQEVRWIKKTEASAILGAMPEVALCVVDVDVLWAASVEFPIAKKDSMLVRKFKEAYPQGPYIIQDEKIDNNLFQVIGIKEEKITEVYALIPSEKIVGFVPYAIALRNTLGQHMDLNQIVVFAEDGGGVFWLTVFHGLKFSRTRTIAHRHEDLLPEIKRSYIDFFKKAQAFLSGPQTGFVMATNNRLLADTLKITQEEIPVTYIPVVYPALEGLKQHTPSIKFGLAQEDFKQQQRLVHQKRIKTGVVFLSLLALGLLYWIVNKVQWQMAHRRWQQEGSIYAHLNERLKALDKQIYRQDIKGQSLNYAAVFLGLLELIPSSYSVYSFKFTKTDRWHIAMTLLAQPEGTIEPIEKLKVLKDAEISDIFVNNQPGKYIQVTL